MRFIYCLFSFLLIPIFLIASSEETYFQKAVHNMQKDLEESENIYDEALFLADFDRWIILLVKAASDRESFLEELQKSQALIQQVTETTIKILPQLKKDKFPAVEMAMIDGELVEVFLNAYMKYNYPATPEEQEIYYRQELMEYELHKLLTNVQELNVETLKNLTSGFTYNFVVTLDKRVIFCDIQDYFAVYEEGSKIYISPNHAILAGGKSVLTSGEIRVLKRGDNQVLLITTRAGHYRPYFHSHKHIKKILEEMGVPSETLIFTAFPIDRVTEQIVENFSDQVKEGKPSSMK